MLYVSTSEVFDNTYPGTIQDRQEIVNTTADRETIKKVIGENVYIQAALVKETDFVIESVRRDKKLKPERCGTKCMFFLDGDEGRLLSDLSAVYRRLKPVTDNEGNLIGYQSSATSPVAIELVKEMAEEGELDDLISHFMLPGETVNKMCIRDRFAYILVIVVLSLAMEKIIGLLMGRSVPSGYEGSRLHIRRGRQRQRCG